MAGELIFEAAEPEHIDELLPLLRALDYQEVKAASGDVYTALHNALRLTRYPVTARLTDGRMVAVFGAAAISQLSDTAAIWLLGTDLMRQHPRTVIEATQAFIAQTREHHPRLLNYVDARNRPSIRWLRSLGFTIDPPVPFGVAGLPFHRFHMGLDDV